MKLSLALVLAVSAASVPAQAQQASVLPTPGEDESSTDPAGEIKIERAHTPEPHYLRNFLELGGSILLGTAWYWIDRERQVADWDYPSWSDKLTFQPEVMIFDNNPFHVNYIWHAFAGGSSHLLGRSNGLGIWSSAAFGLAASVFWEYNIESREKVSVNDLLFTNAVGVPLGEFFHQAAQYVTQGQEGAQWDVARWTLGIAHKTHGLLDGKDPFDRVALTPNFRWHYALDNLSYTRDDGGVIRDGNSRVHELGFWGEIVAMDDYLQQGRRWRGFYKANFTNFGLRMSVGADEASATHSEGDAIIAGFHYQDVTEVNRELYPTAPADTTSVDSFVLGVSAGYLYHRERFGAWRDRLGGLYMPGPAVEARWVRGPLRFRVSGRASFDLMGVNALAWKQFEDANPAPTDPDDTNYNVGKSILRNTGYYYGIGYSARLNAELSYSRFRLGGRLFYGSYESIEGYDRDQDNLPASMEVTGDDRLTDYEMWLSADVYNDLYLRARVGQGKRDSRLGDFEADQTLTRVNLEFGIDY